MSFSDSAVISGLQSMHLGARQPSAAAVNQPPSAASSESAVSAAAGAPQVGSSCREGRSEASVDPIVRTAPEKYGRAIAPEATAKEAVIPVKAHVRGKASEAEAPEKKPVTLEAIVAEYRRFQRAETKRHIFLGWMVERWLGCQPERSEAEQLPRAAAMIVIAARIESEGLAAVARPHRDLKCQHAARILGGEVESLAIGAIYRFLPLVQPAGDAWRLLPGREDQARGLWARMLKEKLSADAVRSAVEKLLPRAAKLLCQSPSRPAQTVFRILPTLSAEELAAVIRAAKEARSKARQAPAIAG